MTKRSSYLGLSLCLALLLSVVFIIQAQQAPTAEAIIQANLRAQDNIESEKVGEIFSGTLYPIIGRSEFFPWVLLGDPLTSQPIGWVFSDLVTIRGDINQVPFSTLDVNAPVVPTAAPATNAPSTVSPTPAVALATSTPTAQFNVTGVTQGEVYIRYGPGVEFQRLGVASAGERFEVTAQHTQFPWLQIRYPASPNGFAWVAKDLLVIEGNLAAVPAVSQTVFNLPTLTPTPPILEVSSVVDGEPIPISPAFAQLGNELWNILLNANFDPETSRFASLFLLDLQTGEAIAFGSNIAYSGTSINKIAILARLYAQLNTPPPADVATDIANTMICSENVATNRLLAAIGNGDEFLGAEETTQFLRQLGLTRTFITAPYTIPGREIVPTRPIILPTTTADQTKANADLSNQLTVDEMGWLLGSIYECGYGEDGPLMTRFPNQYEPRECRQMLHVMSNNTVDALLKAGVPADTRVAHKHGWIEDTHGNAAVFFTPGGDYVLVVMMHQPEWLYFNESLPVMAELSRTVYNYYNPTAPQATIREGFIPEAANCNFAGTPLISDLTAPVWDN